MQHLITCQIENIELIKTFLSPEFLGGSNFWNLIFSVSSHVDRNVLVLLLKNMSVFWKIKLPGWGVQTLQTLFRILTHTTLHSFSQWRARAMDAELQNTVNVTIPWTWYTGVLYVNIQARLYAPLRFPSQGWTFPLSCSATIFSFAWQVIHRPVHAAHPHTLVLRFPIMGCLCASPGPSGLL